jgi:apolipoprotein D and lipocalin family protein
MARRASASALAAVIIASGALAGTAAAAVQSVSTVTPVTSVDLPQYLGNWFQIAAIPLIFEAACAKDATATYTLAADGDLSVANNCTTSSGGDYQVTGEARPDNPPGDSTLSVSFLDFFGLKFFSATPNYDIIGLDPDYQWAVVVSPNLLSAFILSRDPTLSAAEIATTQSILSDNGINPCRLRFTVQDGGASAPTRYCPAT